MIAGLVIYGLLWISFGAGHSFFASPTGRRWLERRTGPADRLAYNAIAALHLALVLAVGAALLGRAPHFPIPFLLAVVMDLALALGVVILLIAGRSYDLAQFLGLAQWRSGHADRQTPPEPLATGGMNALVRHPLYLGLLLVLFGAARSPLALATAMFASVYIRIGISFEERNLLRLYGEDYARYCKRTNMLVPDLTKLRRLLAGLL